MMRIHRRIDEIVDDLATADALKPWYMSGKSAPVFIMTICRHSTCPMSIWWIPWAKRPRSVPRARYSTGKICCLDLLIYATGFEVQQTGIYNDIVEKDVNLSGQERPGIRTLLGIHTAGFPNLFIMGGYQASSNESTEMLWIQGDHAAVPIMSVPTAITRLMLKTKQKSGGCKTSFSTAVSVVLKNVMPVSYKL